MVFALLRTKIVGHHLYNAVESGVVVVKTQFIMHQPEQQQAGRDADREAKNIDGGIHPVFGKGAESQFEIVAQHRESLNELTKR